MINALRKSWTDSHSPSSEDELSAPPTVSISVRNRIIKERESEIQAVDSIQNLARSGTRVIELLRECDALIVTEAKATRAREIVEQFRRETLYTHLDTDRTDPAQKNSASACHPQPFDRLIYLLDRYTEYCSTIGLSAWPVHHLKVAIWIKGDVISLKTRVIPLRKTVRCYITTMETVRVKTRHLFGHSYEADDRPLIACPILKELLDVLPISRVTSNASLHPGDEKHTTGGVDRETLLSQIRSRSGDHKAHEALFIVQASRQGGSHSTSFRHGKKKPDPHMHTLSRYMTFCRSLSVPIWPIEPTRVALWLRESVLSPPSPNSTAYRVSLRTVQVYLSRLEYARVRTESLFKDEFGELAVGSLYRNQAVADILVSFNPDQEKNLGMLSDAFKMEGSLHLSPVLGKRKASSHSLVDDKFRPHDCTTCRPKLEPYPPSSIPSSPEGSVSDCQTLSRSPSPAPSTFSCMSLPNVHHRDLSITSSTSQSRKGCISYILCSEESQDSCLLSCTGEMSPTSHRACSDSPSPSPPSQWSTSPLSIPRSQHHQPRFVIPSFASFSFALSN